ncbi:CAP domain-containing protein [Acetanaerobacterium elongatum]|uniref:Uncharacterized conserved protein YkwD, contains CAP (CSP/antigen 5/PR1) domain n=1 Tax=Acetanaerobacterium elongatum TaxID=258515 RepID=A0A1H0G1X4_9FIRM|nr:CAP domain-containing protein [Acetanaerobacterium elongatum]SDO00860.1 Uncharacterized conserved protein YkwD, contains CAP (CSP/antigen 5/PR1) domain [Acetanaerobacterium elongatum]
MRFTKRFAVIACLMAATSLLLFSCAEGAEVKSSLSNSSVESTSSEDAVVSQQADSSIQSEPDGSMPSSQETPSSDTAQPSSNLVKPATSKAETPVSSGITSPKKDYTSSVVSSKATSSRAASSKGVSSAAASSKPSSSKAASSSEPVSSTPSSDTSGYGPRISDDPSKSSDTSFLAAVEDDILSQLNSLRQSKGLNPLKKSSALAAGARIRAKEMYDYNYFAHSRPDGASWDTVFKVDIKLTGYSRLGENLVKMIGSSPDATAIMNLWINSPGHYANMVTPEYTHVGIGVFYGTVTGQGKTLYAVQEFGTFN